MLPHKSTDNLIDSDDNISSNEEEQKSTNHIVQTKRKNAFGDTSSSQSISSTPHKKSIIIGVADVHQYNDRLSSTTPPPPLTHIPIPLPRKNIPKPMNQTTTIQTPPTMQHHNNNNNEDEIIELSSCESTHQSSTHSANDKLNKNIDKIQKISDSSSSVSIRADANNQQIFFAKNRKNTIIDSKQIEEQTTSSSHMENNDNIEKDDCTASYSSTGSSTYSQSDSVEIVNEKMIKPQSMDKIPLDRFQKKKTIPRTKIKNEIMESKFSDYLYENLIGAFNVLLQHFYNLIKIIFF